MQLWVVMFELRVYNFALFNLFIIEIRVGACDVYLVACVGKLGEDIAWANSLSEEHQESWITIVSFFNVPLSYCQHVYDIRS